MADPLGGGPRRRWPTKPEGQKDQCREVIEAFYRDPVARLNRWRQLARNGMGEADGVPCFEHRALKRFFAKFRRGPVPLRVEEPADFGQIAALCVRIPQSATEIGESWCHPAIHAWDRLRSLIDKGHAASRGESAIVGDAVIAVATILNDARVLQWCVSTGLLPSTVATFAPEGIRSADWEWLGQTRKRESRGLLLRSLSLHALFAESAAASLVDLSDSETVGSVPATRSEDWIDALEALALHLNALMSSWPRVYALQLACHPDVVGEQVASTVTRAAD